MHQLDKEMTNDLIVTKAEPTECHPLHASPQPQQAP
mgnify:CR=1 FL=1